MVDNILKKNILSVLVESSRTDDCFTNSVYSDADMSEFISIVGDMDEIEDEEVYFSEDMVPVIQHEHGSYIVEFDMLHKLMSFNEMSASEAFYAVCESNGLSKGDVYVCLEEAEYLKEAAKKLGGSEAPLKAKGKMHNALKTVKDLKDKGIHMVTKKKKKPGMKSKRKNK